MLDQNFICDYHEIEKSPNLNEEILSFTKLITFQNPKNSPNYQICDTILTNIFGYMIMKCYQKMKKHRLVNIVPISKSNYKKDIGNDEYLILKDIGYGSIFKTQLIYYLNTNDILVLKTPYVTDNEIDKLNQREIENYMKISHPLLPKYYGSNKNRLFIEYINGCRLSDICMINLNDNEKLKIILDLMLIFQYLHQNDLIYRDLKPNNVIIDQNKTAVLIDFDRMITSNHGLFSCEFAMYYSAPEINSDNVTSKCDIYSLGQIIYFIMKGKNPVKNEIDFGKYFFIQDIYIKCTKKDPTERPTITDLLLDFYLVYYSQMKSCESFSLYSDYVDNIYHETIKIADFEVNEKDISALNKLGHFYYSGQFIKVNINKAIYYFSLAAEQNDPESLYIILVLFMTKENMFLVIFIKLFNIIHKQRN